MTNFVQLSVLQLVRAIESTSSVLPIKRLCVSVICECDVHDAKPDCCPYTDDVATGQPLQLVLTVFDSMLLQLSVEPMVGQPHRDLLIRIVSDLREHGFSAPQTEWIPRLLDHICRHSAADVHDIVISNDVESGRHETLSRWARQIQAAGVDSGSIVSELDAGPFRSSALDYAVIAKARDLSFQSVVAQSHREAQAQSANRSTNSHSSSTPTPTARPSGDRQTCRYEETNTMAYPYYPTSYSAARGRTGFFEDPPPIGAAELHELQKHVVNLNGGRFSTDGSFTSSLASTRAIFRDHIPRWASGASPDGPVRVVLYAHGGLTNEAWGLHTAAKQLEWWKANGVYPVFFVWETGLWETLAQMFGDAAENLGLGGTRGWFDDLRQGIADGWDRLRDGTWESLTRRLGVGRLWGRMKQSAEDSFAGDGDGRLVMEELSMMCEGLGSRIKLYGVGHSAGSIFLTHAINSAAASGIPAFKSIHFLAPAITNELFKYKFLHGAGLPDNVKRLSLFTMNDALELSDTVGPYKKSLLYLIYYALEPKTETDVLGLERSLRGDEDIAHLFGLHGNAHDERVDLVFSKTAATSGRSASQSDTHGGFDDDPATMESVLRRIKRLSDDAHITPFPRDSRGGGNPFEWATFQRGTTGFTGGSSSAASRVYTAASSGSGQKRALCIGINEYATKPLSGCVADATRWRDWFQKSGFSTEALLDQHATYANILVKMRELFSSSRAGDVVAIQFAGHGTQLPDDDGDERYGDSPGLDEAFVPYDYMTAGLLVDDEIGRCCEEIPKGVSVTFFMDCCHSGTNTRFFIAGSDVQENGVKARYLPPSKDMIAAHRKARASRGLSRGVSAYKGKSEILFSACLSTQVAYETNGQGDFTRHSMDVLAQTNGQLTCRDFVDEVSRRFGARRRQTPDLVCDESLEDTALLAPRGQVDTSGPPAGDDSKSDRDGNLRDVLLEIRRLLENV